MITINMIIESLPSCEVIKQPGHRSQSFDELIMLDDEPARSLSIASSKNALFCGRPSQTQAFKSRYPDAWTFCIFPISEAPIALGQAQKHSIMCYSDMPYERICSKLVMLFSEVSAWTQRMKTLVLEDGSYQGLLNISEPILKNFISISDSQFRLLAYTPNIKIDDPVTLRVLELGYHPEETIEVFRQYGIMRDWEKQTRIEKRRAVFTKYPTMDYVFRMEGNYYLHVVMQCNNIDPTPAYVDAFQLLIDHIGYCVKQEYSQKYLLTDEPSAFFADLITRRMTTEQQIANRMEATTIPNTGKYRLIGFNFDRLQGKMPLLSYYAQHVKDAFPNAFVGIFNQTVLLLDPYAENIAEHRERLLAFLNSHPCIVGVSRIFADMKSFVYAFQEVMVAIDTSTISNPTLAQYYEKGGSPINIFDHLFPFYVANTAKADDPLIEHIANTGTLAKMAKYDKEHNSNDLHILYWYLVNERKAKPTCDRLFMHRNTLMYRISTMQERFGFDLDDAHTRMRLTMEFLLMSL